MIDQQQVQNLALNGRNFIQLLSFVPGVALLNDDQLELTTSLATNNQSINGNRGQTNNVTIDGGFNLQSGSNASQINNLGIDYIQEVKIQTSNFSAEYGRNSGAQVSLVTRSGGNDFTAAHLSSSKRQTRRALVLCAREAGTSLQQLRLQLWWSNLQRQTLFLRRAGVEIHPTSLSRTTPAPFHLSLS